MRASGAVQTVVASASRLPDRSGSCTAPSAASLGCLRQAVRVLQWEAAPQLGNLAGTPNLSVPLMGPPCPWIAQQRPAALLG